MKILDGKFLTGNASFSTLFKEAENRLSISCLVCATELTQYTIYEPRCEKTGIRGFRPGPTQTGLYSHRRWLET